MATWPKFDFEVGDVICRERNGRPLVVSAVGKKRFLYIPLSETATEERVSHKRIYSHPFRKWDPRKYPDSHYAYVKEIKQSRHSLLNDVQIKWPNDKEIDGTHV